MAVANAVNSQLYGFHWLRDSIDSQEQLAAILDKCLTDVFGTLFHRSITKSG